MVRESRSPENVLALVDCQTIVVGGNSVVILTVRAFATAASREMDAEVARKLFGVIRLRVAGVQLGVAARQGLLFVFEFVVGQVFVVPYVVLLVTYDKKYR